MNKIMFLALLLFTLPTKALTPHGEFNVSARNAFGTAFTNPYPFPIFIDFSARGTWGFQSGSTVTAEGDWVDQCGNYGNCPIDWAPIGYLVIKRGLDFFTVGSDNQVNLEANETIYFLINDAATSFDNNHGALSIEWFCLDGCPVN